MLRTKELPEGVIRSNPDMKTDTTVSPCQGPINNLPLGASLYATFLCILFGANPTAIKISLEGFGIFTVAGLRFSIAALALILWAALTRRPLALKSKKQVLQMGKLALIFITQITCFYTGLSKTTASHGTLIANLLPFIVLILAHFYIPGDRITMKKSIGIVFGFSGVLCLLLDQGGFSGEIHRGDFFVFVAVSLWGCNAVYLKRIIADYHAVQVTVYPMLFSIPFFFMAGWFWDAPMVGTIDTSVFLSILYQSLVTAAYGFISWNLMLQKFGATAMHTFVFIMPVSGVFFGVSLLGEPLTAALIMSIILIATGIMVVHLHLPRQKKQALPMVKQ
ncbi:Permease of the drug/metabolite transporter (DMT) superfamily [Desulfocicer vacuolatum DSM 3385]|uniref:Permease of the drug/metabolite transporter (DMT) superfamily n=1 Tax=Desulfocicer vacuolatum DSM 3385 TaxID=1121400 RepID=A0A1W2CYA0_9BACT|nr:DMT family transporter [Desulfocicer vacuolatum]SMC90249.1 Permease of the drug/metabolite transporter (DMT) superfamily [Desulfocicer vacuolatum DSM 3385]